MATSEVEGIIMRIAGLSDCVVYGVEVGQSEIIRDNQAEFFFVNNLDPKHRGKGRYGCSC